nr:putative aspartate aminotransferase, cytoplasmic 2 [Anolis sagrei ordinatus]
MGTLSVFLDVPLTETDLPLDVYREDPSPKKVCLGHTGCQTDCPDETWIPLVVQRVLLKIPQDPTLDHEYLPHLGMTAFTTAAMELLIGKDNHALLENRAGAVQTVGGTGALWIGAEFLNRWYKPNDFAPATVYISVPQIGNLGCIFHVAGFTNICTYHYWDPVNLTVNTQGLLEELQNMIPHFPYFFFPRQQSLKTLVKRIMLIREKLKEKLRILGTPGSWEHLTAQSGVNSFIGLLPSQVDFLAKRKHIYLLPNGQINICSINSRNLNYVAQSIHEAVVSTTVEDHRPSTDLDDPARNSIDEVPARCSFR